MTRPRWDETLLAELTRVMTDASICGLGQAAMNPVKQVLKHFREDVLATGAAEPTPTPGKPARY
jgi:formate dehydrogenase